MSEFTLDKLTEGIRQRNLGSSNKAVVDKWDRTGLLRGLSGVYRENMARLLENQASQVLKEVNTLGGAGGGDVRGFTNVAFPIVRRVFGGLVANELVSIQPMSLPSGLLFYLDYTRGSDVSGPGYGAGESIYNSPVGKEVRRGSDAVGGLYDLAGQSYTRTHVTSDDLQLNDDNFPLRGTYTSAGAYGNGKIQVDDLNGITGRLVQFDPQLTAHIEAGGEYRLLVAELDAALKIDATQVKEIVLTQADGLESTTKIVAPGEDHLGNPFQVAGTALNIKRLNLLGKLQDDGVFIPDPFVDADKARVLFVVRTTANIPNAEALAVVKISGPLGDSLDATSEDATTLVIPSFESDFGQGPGGPQPVIPEIDIKVEAVPVVATTRKLRARWSPELAQDLNAYHSLDAEVELTQILSEQIALEIDREILNDLLTQATAANYFWSRAPGKFVNKESGRAIIDGAGGATGPIFRGTVREWYETLTETIIDVANQIHRKTLRGSANFIVVGPDVATILESSVMYKPNYSLDGSGQVGGMTIGAEKVGSLSNRFTVYKDPYFPRNKILVGYKGGSYLESGYVYAPYVPLIVTPTIFAPEDFTPRKGVMTRYGKKMVRADFFGTVTCLDMSVI
jgi:hypothetical protein